MLQRSVVVTGANRGIGLAVSRELARAGCRVYVVARDADAGRRVEHELGASTSPTGGRASASPMDVRFVEGDLACVRSTRAAAHAIAAACPKIDVLVHNAGVWPSRRELNEDGVERAFAVNHVAPFLLNHLLADALVSGARVVQVSAGLYVKGRVDLTRTPTGDDFHPIRTYASTKLCNLLLLERHAERFSRRGVTINAVHPGVLRTGLGDRPGAFGLVVRAVKRLWKPAEAGAPPIVRLALAPEVEGVTGRYFHLDQETPLAEVARDTQTARALWDHAEALFRRAGGAHHAASDARVAGE